MTFGSKMFGSGKQMAKHGRFGDTLLAHINPQEAALLKARGGSGTINPMTGALEFANRDDFDADFYLDQFQDVAKAGYGAGSPDDENFLDPFEHYQQYGRLEGRAGNVAEQQAQDLGAYTGMFDEDFYLENNPDVAQALADDTLGGISARDHFNIFGQSEKRTTNQLQQDIKDAGFGGRFGRLQGLSSYDDNMEGGGRSDRATDRFNMLSGNTTGSTADQLAEDGPAGTNFLNEAQSNIRGDIMGSGDFAYDLLGNTAGMSSQEIIDQLQPRVDLADSGYMGSFNPSTVTAYRASYSDFDNDPSTPFSAANASNIGRAGTDVSNVRDAIRGIGYTGRFGTGEAETFISDKLTQYGLMPSGDTGTDLNNIKMQQQYEAAILAAEAARNAELGGNLPGPGMGPGPVITLPDTKAEAPVEVDTPDIAVDIPTSTASPVVTAPPPTTFGNTFMQNFRPTRINPFTGALEYLPTQMPAPTAFSQALNPRFAGGFGTGIRL